ncbi:hypothetical protein [Petroclostridium sp. X23]|uniref:hypothetical protein n=1 Tax=Petroclostridium sp. X23 TaxID=3045146 RepID=UPI0024AD548B|nr:hypothetical protein [Petroclostridium sp. X23]WHH60398.1 hypothetical protein QKW49_06650 [Petroclostridium sp. X23]
MRQFLDDLPELTEYSDTLLRAAPQIIIKEFKVSNLTYAGRDIGHIGDTNIYQEINKHDAILASILEQARNIPELQKNIDTIATQLNKGLKSKDKEEKKSLLGKAKSATEFVVSFSKMCTDQNVQATVQWLMTQAQERINDLINFIK